MNGKAQARPPGDGYRQLAVAQLLRVAGFDELDPALVKKWVEAGELMALKRGDVISRRGDPCQGLLLVIEGAIAIGRYLGQRDAHVLTYLGRGDLGSLSPLIDGGPETHDLMAHEPSWMLRVSNTLVQAALTRDPALRFALIGQLTHRNRLLCDRIYEANSQPLSFRLARQLDFLGQHFGTPRPGGVLVTIRVSQTDLAQVLGASRQQVNAELKKFERRGLISLSRARVTLRDPEGLATAGHGSTSMTLRSTPRAAPSPPPAQPEGGELRGCRVLLVEDDAISRIVLASHLQQAGADVDEAETGDAALLMAAAAQPPYDAIVMDEHMPGLSGSMATQRIREHQAAAGLPRTPILGVSADAGRDDTRRFLAAGMDEHVAKPIRRSELVAALRRLIEAAGGGGAEV